MDLQKWADRKTAVNKVFMVLSVLFLSMSAVYFMPATAKAASAVTVKEIDYRDSTITLQVNEGDTAVYFSDSLKRTWEAVPGKINSDRTITMDISWVSTTKNYIITFKGDKSTDITSVAIPKQVTNFKASYNKAKGTISFSNAGNRVIEWRKKDSTVWHNVNTDTISNELSYYYTNGANVLFRLAPVNGTGSTYAGLRPSKEVSVSIPKKIAAPSVRIDGSRFLINGKKGISYRKLSTDGTFTEWQTLTRTTDLLLSDIAPQAMYNNGTAQEEVTLQFRTNATTTAQVSNIATVTVPIQEGAPDTERYGISLSFTSSTNLSLQVKSAASSAPFEYTIVKPDSNLNYLTADWNSITSNSAVSIRKSAAPVGSHIYVRKKSLEASEETAFALASVETDITGAGGVTYPGAPQAGTLTNLITAAGVCRPENTAGYLTFSLYSPTQTTVASIDIYDAYGNKKGTVTSKSSVAVNRSSTGTEDKYIITSQITSTESIDSFTNETLYANITLANSDSIISTSASGIHLYLYDNTKINNPGDAYTNDFRRIYMSKDQADETGFKFQLKLGTTTVNSSASTDGSEAQATEINTIEYCSYRLIKDTDYTVTYSTVTDDNGKTVTTADVSVNVAAFEDKIPAAKLDQKLPLIIKLNDNEILKNNVFITLVSTAVMEDIPIAWSITEGSLKETKTSTVTNSDGTTRTITEEVITYTIDLTLFDSGYAVSVSDVTWGDQSIMGSATVSAGEATINLSNAKINKLTTQSTDTKNVVITLSNGFVIRNGCKLTIIKAS